MRCVWLRSPYPLLAVLLGTLPLLSGCAGAFGVTGDAKQIHELAKIKDSNCVKMTGVYLGATVNITAVSVDKGIPIGAGIVTINKDCEVTITQEKPKP